MAITPNSTHNSAIPPSIPTTSCAVRLSAILIRSEVFWEFVIDTTLNLAVNVADGKFPDSPKDRERYFTLIAKGLGGVLSPGKSWAEK